MQFRLAPPDEHLPTSKRRALLLDHIQTTVQVHLPAILNSQVKKAFVALLNKLWSTPLNSQEAISRRNRITECCNDAFIFWDKSKAQGISKPIRCYDPLCPICQAGLARKLERRFRFHIERMQNPHLWTFTIRSSARSAQEARDKLLLNFKTLRKRKLWKDNVKGGLWIFEITFNKDTREWHPHLHCILDTSFLPWLQIKEAWQAITGDSFIVHYRPLEGKRQAARYLTKYLLKESAITGLSAGEFEELLQVTRSSRKFGTFGSAYSKSLKDLLVQEQPPELLLLGRFSNRWYWTNLPFDFSFAQDLACQTMSRSYWISSPGISSMDNDDPPELYHGPSPPQPPLVRATS